MSMALSKAEEKELARLQQAVEDEKEKAAVTRQFQFIAGRHDLLLERYCGALAAAGVPLAAVNEIREKEILFVNQMLARVAQQEG
jgi:hypothetical protein